MKKLSRIEVESLRDTIKSNYDFECDYDSHEQEVMKLYQLGYINKSDFIENLKTHYEYLEELAEEEE